MQSIGHEALLGVLDLNVDVLFDGCIHFGLQDLDLLVWLVALALPIRQIELLIFKKILGASLRRLA